MQLGDKQYSNLTQALDKPAMENLRNSLPKFVQRKEEDV